MNNEELLKEIGLNDFISLDLETTGLRISDDEIIEISAIHFKNGEVFNEFTTLAHLLAYSFIKPISKLML